MSAPTTSFAEASDTIDWAALAAGLPADVALGAVVDADFDALAALRESAMRESLQALGRFDPQRSRERLRDGFDPRHARHLLRHGRRVGLVIAYAEPEGTGQCWRLDHLYIEPAAQGAGLGSALLRALTAAADAGQRPLVLTALQGSAANRLYRRHGFRVTSENTIDVEQRRP